jgi:hypothetical protein
VDEAVLLAQRLKALGVDVIDCSSGGAIPRAKIAIGPGYQVPFAERIRREADIQTAAVGLITSPAQANEIITRGCADIVLLARELLREPYWPLKAPRNSALNCRLPRSMAAHSSVVNSKGMDAASLNTAVWPVLLFYKYVPIADPEEFTAQQRALCSRLGLKGRVLIAAEGINGTLAGPTDAVNEYTAALNADPRFADVTFKVSAGDEKTFPKLVVKVRPEIVTLGEPDLVAKPGKPTHARGMEADDGGRSGCGPSRRAATAMNPRAAASKARWFVTSRTSVICPPTSLNSSR